MRVMLMLLLGTMLMWATHVRAAPACADRELAVAAQIHDYAHVQSVQLLRSRELVARVYEKIGVRLEWLATVQQPIRRAQSDVEDIRPPAQIAQLTVIIETDEMAKRGNVPDGVLGYAAVPGDGGMGRIAYVIYERVHQIAREGGRNESDLLAFVMAHETGHLLLGRGVRAPVGLMKCHWDRREMQRLEAHTLEFSEAHALRIRNALENRLAADAGVACATASSASPEEHLR
jgi:hypothetical protein